MANDVKISLSPEEKELLAKIAEKLGTNPSALARQVLVEGWDKLIEKAEKIEQFKNNAES